MNITEEKNESPTKDVTKSGIGLLFLPEGSKAIAQIPISFIDGSFSEKVIAILSGQTGPTEVTNNEYEVLRELLPICDIEFKILVGIPDVDSPRSFLAEDHMDRVISFYNLEFTPDTESSQFTSKILENIEEEFDLDEDNHRDA